MNYTAIVSSVFVAVMILSGCASEKPAANAQQAIEESRAKGTVEQQADYLVGQAKGFLNEKNYDQAMATANHVLSNLDQNSQAAKDILLKAKDEMQKTAQDTVNNLKNQFGTK